MEANQGGNSDVAKLIAKDLIEEYESSPEYDEGDQSKLEENIAECVETAFKKHPDQRACPCLYGDPCNDACTCVNITSSRGCDYCCTYGSVMQRKNKAIRLKALLSTNDSTF